MKTRKSRHFAAPRLSVPRASIGAVVAASLAVTPAQGAFHLWSIREVYTDASGANQFIELFNGSGFDQPAVGGHQISISDGVTTHTYTVPGNVNNTIGQALLFGTASITNFGSPKPDFVISNNFILPNGATLTFFGLGSGPYTALPTDGVNSRTWNGGNATNSPQNLLGQVGTISILNSPPSVSITNPPVNSLFAAPATVPVSVSTSDDGTVANVQLLTNGVPAATNTVAPFGFTLFGLLAGNYTLRAVATDNGSLSATSAPVVVRVADRPTLAVSPGITGPIKFQFNTVTGIDYVVERATPLTNFSAVVTNPGTGGILQFGETDASASQRSYRVRLQ